MWKKVEIPDSESLVGCQGSDSVSSVKHSASLSEEQAALSCQRYQSCLPCINCDNAQVSFPDIVSRNSHLHLWTSMPVVAHALG